MIIGIVCEKILESSRFVSLLRCIVNEWFIYLKIGFICVWGKLSRLICKDGEDFI